MMTNCNNHNHGPMLPAHCFTIFLQFNTMSFNRSARLVCRCMVCARACRRLAE